MTCVSFSSVFGRELLELILNAPRLTRQVTCGEDSGDRNWWMETGLFKADLEQVDRGGFPQFSVLGASGHKELTGENWGTRETTGRGLCAGT